MLVTAEHLRAIMPNLKKDQAAKYLPPLQTALEEAKINTPLRIAAFLAQIAHESGELRYWEELASGKAYEGREDLGNTSLGDGPRYKGRGPIQLTGRANYGACGKDLGLDLEGCPELVSTPEVGFRSTCWFWTKNGLNALADAQDLVKMTRRINGGTNGLADRMKYYDRALRVLGPLTLVAT